MNGIDEINWEFEPDFLPPRGFHRGYCERELITDCDKWFYGWLNFHIKNMNIKYKKNFNLFYF